MIPEDYQKVLKNIRKVEDRKKKNKSSAQDGQEDDQSEESAVSNDRKSRKSRKSRKIFEGDDDLELFDDVDHEDDQDEGKSIRKSRQFDISSRLSSKTIKSYIKEDVDGDPIDLLNPSQANKAVFSRIPKSYQNSNKQPQEVNIEDEDAKVLARKLPIAADGRLNLGALLNKLDKSKPDNDSAVKRKLNEDSDDDEEDDREDAIEHKSVLSGKSYRPGGRGIHRNTAPSVRSAATSKKSNKSRKSNQSTVNRGDAYKSKKAQGDMKRRSLPDPYAYYPLSAGSMNKRKQLKHRGQFKALVKGAQKGSAKGVKRRKKDNQ